ncbi:arabinogalactan protein 41-like [Pistacia vera]|uniref:arabinogalactan protein 41-like n=1 Tax=Pistacia vera TaxID=55513 RepID=UPI001263496F|nr:arabinogalactan protein 41-like [Pistacia vera]
MDTLKLQFIGMGIIISTLVVLGVGMSNAQNLSPAPAPTSDGVAIDQGIAYVLMLLALVLTYIIH